ncbi:MAG: GIY-YIG nuclease family protein [bacterium]|nr:GIY-YIG nuclease family protein [bacterium]
MVYAVYILYSQKDKRLYVGCTSNLKERLRRHQAGQVQATKLRRPLVLIREESSENKTDAFKRERFLKSLWGSREKKKILKRYLDGLNPRANL